MTTAVVTGAHGFVGSHLVPMLTELGWTVVGVGRAEASPAAGERYVRADVTQPAAISEVFAAVRPDVVFHLAGVSGQQVTDPAELVREVTLGTQVVCEGLRRVGLRARLVLAGSSAQYGSTAPDHGRIDETDACQPIGAYGHAKVAAEASAFALSADGAFELVAARSFNHVGPGESTFTVCGAIAARVGDVLKGRVERIAVRDATVVRDFSDVRDVARAYIALARDGSPGHVYNVCSGRSASVADVVDGLLAAAGLDRSVVDLVPGGASALPRQVGSPAKIEAATDWTAGIALRDSLADLLASVVGAAPTSAGALDGQ